MSQRNFIDLLEGRLLEGKFVCVGLDTEFERIPERVRSRSKDQLIATHDFNREIIIATHDLVCAYKPNIAFYEAWGEHGVYALKIAIEEIHSVAPRVPIILDAKRADIGNTNRGYYKAAFDYLQADAITVHPYLGKEALSDFLAAEDKGVFVLCRTSNLGAGEFQDLLVDGKPLYQHVAQNVAAQWNEHGNCGLVVGATYPEELAAVRALAPNLPILIPGIGAQGGDLEATVRAGKDSRNRGMIINSSRGIIYASSGPDFAEAARRETEKLHNQISQLLAV